MTTTDTTAVWMTRTGRTGDICLFCLICRTCKDFGWPTHNYRSRDLWELKELAPPIPYLSRYLCATASLYKVPD